MKEQGKLSDYLDLEQLSRIPQLELQARLLVDGFLNGVHLSPFQGSNVEFKEHRKYVHGDEIRSIDWKAYARTDRLHIRLHEEDTNLNAYLFLDRSASMDYRSPDAIMGKFEFARAVCAALMLFLEKQKDAFTFSFLERDWKALEKPSTKEVHFRRLLETMAVPADSEAFDWQKTAMPMLKDVRPRSIVIFVSDFYVKPDNLTPILDLLKQKSCEVLFFHVFDPAERDFLSEEAVRLQDAETNLKLSLTPELIRQSYQERFQAHVSELSGKALSCGGEYLPLCTENPPLDVFSTYLKARAGKRKRR